MKTDKIKEIVNNDMLPDDLKESLILQVIAKDENAIPNILEILATERRHKTELIKNMNVHLSKAHCAIISPKLNKEGFVQEEIVQFYTDNKTDVGHCFINLNL